MTRRCSSYLDFGRCDKLNFVPPLPKHNHTAWVHWGWFNFVGIRFQILHKEHEPMKKTAGSFLSTIVVICPLVPHFGATKLSCHQRYLMASRHPQT